MRKWGRKGGTSAEVQKPKAQKPTRTKIWRRKCGSAHSRSRNPGFQLRFRKLGFRLSAALFHFSIGTCALPEKTGFPKVQKAAFALHFHIPASQTTPGC